MKSALLILAAVATAQTISVKATSGSQTATASVAVSRNVAPSTITLPVEVGGPDGTSTTVSFQVATGVNVNAALTFSAQIHGLKYQTEASLRWNNSAWTPINDTTVTLQGSNATEAALKANPANFIQGPASYYGGIGGGYHTLSLTMAIPPNTLKVGTNTLALRFNGTDGLTSAFRMLTFNILDLTGTAILPATLFVQDDPSKWTPPLNNLTDIAAGKALFQTAQLHSPMTGLINAKCNSCHTQDGRDLKYFNYSNYSIRARSMFHALTAQQGDQIASYIRSLNVANPGRPWNPPYQPGPGLDAKPVAQWAAGAGLSAVLSDCTQMTTYLLASNFAASAHLNQREMPVCFQLPDWNRWLPGVHPMDAYPEFATSAVNTSYAAIRTALGTAPATATAYKNAVPGLLIWRTNFLTLAGPYQVASTDAAWTNPQYARNLQSIGQWSMVKNWELNKEFGLEGMPSTAFGVNADLRAWASAVPFANDPNILHIPTGNGGLWNGTAFMFTYMSEVWYHLQLILNDGNGTFSGNTPIDFPYAHPFIAGFATPTAGTASLLLQLLVIGLQQSNYGPGPEAASAGWQPNSVNDISALTRYPNSPKIWKGYTPAQRTALLNAYLTAWLAKITTYTPQQFYTGGWADPAVNPNWANPNDQYWGTRLAFAIPSLRYWGASSTLVDQVVAFAQTIWPNYNWGPVKTATCTDNGSPWIPCTLGQ